MFPPEPSKYLRPQNTLPSDRFIHRFSCRSHTSHRQPLEDRDGAKGGKEMERGGESQREKERIIKWWSGRCRDNERLIEN